MNMIIAYDIAHPRRLYRIAKVLLDYGQRVQNSIFEVDVNPQRFSQLRQRAEAILDPDVDGVKYFPLCGNCAGLVATLGGDSRSDEQQGSLLII